MPKGPQGQKRPADVVGNADHIMRIATSEIDDVAADDGKDPAAKALGAAPEASKGRYSPAGCIGARKEAIEGEPDMKHNMPYL